MSSDEIIRITGRIEKIKAELIPARKAKRKTQKAWEKAHDAVDAAENEWDAAFTHFCKLKCELEDANEELEAAKEEQL